MDPDQVDAADPTAYAVADACRSVGGDECWACALLRRGWDLSRKAAIAGVAATAAPVVAPPIIILSMAGVALSVPFVACLVSLAATDRLMGALLRPAPPQPYYTYDLGEEESEQEFVDASEAPDQEALVFGHWSKTEEGAIMEQNERFASLPLSREPRLSEELVPLLADEEGDSAEGEFAIKKSGHELFVQRDGKQKGHVPSMEVDNEYITMEAPSPGDVSVLEAPVFRDEETLVWRMEDAPGPAKELVQELSVPENENKTEDGGTFTATVEMSRKEMLSPGVDVTELSNLGLQILGDDDNMILSEGEGTVLVRNQEQDFHVSDSGDKTEQHNKTTEVTPQHELSVSESPVPVPSKLEHEPAVEVALQEEIRDTNLVTEEVVDVQLDVVVTVEPESDFLQSRHEAAHELQAMTESIYVYDTLGNNLTEDIVKDTDNKSAEVVEHYDEGRVPCMVPMDDGKDLTSSRSRLNVSSIGDEGRVGNKPHADYPNQTTCVAKKQYGKQEVAEDKCIATEETKTLDDKVPIIDMAAQDDRISKSLVPGYQCKTEDEAALEAVPEEVTCSISAITGEEVEVEVDIIARESESWPMRDLVGQDIQEMTKAGTIVDKTEEIEEGISDSKVVDMEHQTGGGSSSFVTATSVLTMGDGDDLMSSWSTRPVSAASDDFTRVEQPDLEHHHQSTGVELKVHDGEFETKMLTEDKDTYTKEQLREQLDTLRTITGYRAVPSLTLEGELAGLYIFVGVEPPHSSGGGSSLTELNTKLRFLKSIIGVE